MFTRELMTASGTLGICIPGVAAIDLTFAVGSSRDVDKFALYGVISAPGPVSGVPVIETGCSAWLEAGCSAWLECRLIRESHTENAYDTCFAEVVSAAADPRIFANGHWNVDESNGDLHTIHHLGAGKFVQASNMRSVKPL